MSAPGATDPLLPSNQDPSPNPQPASEPQIPSAPFANMGMSLSTARIVAPLSFVIDFAAQVYGMTSSPNMKDIHDRNLASFSPQPFAIAGFFSPQQIIQLLWLRELWRSNAEVEPGTLRYVPWYALGNGLIATWMIFWNQNNLQASNVLVTINTFTQLYYVFALRNRNTKTYQSKLTNIVNITFAGIGILDFLHNTSAAYFPGVTPNFLVKAATTLLAPLTALFSPLLLGSCVAYDLGALAVGQHELASKALNGLGGGGGEGWARLLGGLGIGVAGLVGARAWGGAKWL